MTHARPGQTVKGFTMARMPSFAALEVDQVRAVIAQIEADHATTPWTAPSYPGTYAMQYLCAHAADFGYDPRFGLSRASLAAWLEERMPDSEQRERAIVELAEAHMREHRIVRAPYTFDDISKIGESAFLRRHHDVAAG